MFFISMLVFRQTGCMQCCGPPHCGSHLHKLHQGHVQGQGCGSGYSPALRTLQLTLHVALFCMYIFAHVEILNVVAARVLI